MTNNKLKQYIITIAISTIIVGIMWGVLQQRQFFFQTLIIIMMMFVIVSIQGGVLSIEKLKGKNIYVEYDGITGTIVSKPKYLGDYEVEYQVSFVEAYLPDKYRQKDKTFNEILMTMLTRTHVVRIKDKISRFQEVQNTLAPEGTIQYFGSITGRLPTSRQELLEKQLIEANDNLAAVRTTLFKVKNELNKQAGLDMGSISSTTQHISNMIEKISPKLNVIDVMNRRRGED